MTSVIRKKEHWGDKALRREIIPAGVCEIGDWAYAHCVFLKQLALPSSVCTLGKDVFLGCGALELVILYTSAPSFPAEAEAFRYWIGRLNAAALLHFREPLRSLLPDPCKCETTKSRTESAEVPSAEDSLADRLLCWEQACSDLLSLPDDTGFSPFLAGGEEDYTESDEEYRLHCSINRLMKARILYLRLLADHCCEELAFSDNDTRELFLKRFREFPEAIDLLQSINSHYLQTAELYSKAGLLHPDNIDRILSGLNEEQTELRSALLQKSSGSLFSHLSL